MVAGDTTVQQVLVAVAEQVRTLDGLKEVHANPPTKLGQTPALVLSWFNDLPTTIVHGSDQLWIIACKATLYGAPIKGNDPIPDIASYQLLIHPIVDLISQHPQKYPFGSAMAELYGVDRIQVVSVRPAQFDLEYAAHRYYGAELNMVIKLHRRISY